MRISMRVILPGILVLSVFLLGLRAAELPHIKMLKGTGQLIVNGQPFLMLGGDWAIRRRERRHRRTPLSPGSQAYMSIPSSCP